MIYESFNSKKGEKLLAVISHNLGPVRRCSSEGGGALATMQVHLARGSRRRKSGEYVVASQIDRTATCDLTKILLNKLSVCVY